MFLGIFAGTRQRKRNAMPLSEHRGGEVKCVGQLCAEHTREKLVGPCGTKLEMPPDKRVAASARQPDRPIRGSQERSGLHRASRSVPGGVDGCEAASPPGCEKGLEKSRGRDVKSKLRWHQGVGQRMHLHQN